MIKLDALAAYITDTLNNNDLGVIFDIKTDRNEYENAKLKTQEFVVPGVLIAQAGTREPTTSVDIYYQPVSIELFGYSCLPNEHPAVPFSKDDQKELLEQLATNLNANLLSADAFFEDEGSYAKVFLNTSTVSVGTQTNVNGGGYTRLPMLWSVTLTVLTGATIFNELQRTITTPDGQTRTFASLTPALEKVTNRNVFSNSVINRSYNESKKRVFNGVLWYKKGDSIFNEEFVGDNLNTAYTVNFDGNTFNCTITSLAVNGADGGLVTMSVTLEEVQQWTTENTRLL